jgi:lipopolysaccharide export system protein LptA
MARFATILALAALAALAPAATAQIPGLPGGVGAGGGNAPVTIEADDGVEWRQNEEVYVARGNATAKRGDTTVRADSLIAHYRKGAEGRQEIYKLVADGRVKITTAKETAEGDRGEYDVEAATFVLTGRAVKLTTEKHTITARDRLTYNSKIKVAQVIGDATVIEDKRKVRADRFVAHLKEEEGKTAMRKVEAFGNVIITTPSEVVRGDRGDYDAESGIATLTGNVRLTRGDNQLNGDRAIVNFKTNVSRVEGRVSIYMPQREGGEGGNRDPIGAPKPAGDPKRTPPGAKPPAAAPGSPPAKKP